MADREFRTFRVTNGTIPIGESIAMTQLPDELARFSRDGWSFVAIVPQDDRHHRYTVTLSRDLPVSREYRVQVLSSRSDMHCPKLIDLPVLLEAQARDGWTPVGGPYATEPTHTWFEILLVRDRK